MFFSNEIRCVQSDDSKNGNQKYSISRCMLFVCQLSKEIMLNAHTECEWFNNRHVQYNRLAAIGTTAWADKHNETNWWSHWWVNIWRESRIRSGSRSRRAIEFEECCFISGAFRVFGIFHWEMFSFWLLWPFYWIQLYLRCLRCSMPNPFTHKMQPKFPKSIWPKREWERKQRKVKSICTKDIKHPMRWNPWFMRIAPAKANRHYKQFQ